MNFEWVLIGVILLILSLIIYLFFKIRFISIIFFIISVIGIFFIVVGYLKPEA